MSDHQVRRDVPGAASAGTPEAARRLQRVLTSDPGMGVARHADAGYPEAVAFAKQAGIKIPML